MRPAPGCINLSNTKQSFIQLGGYVIMKPKKGAIIDATVLEKLQLKRCFLFTVLYEKYIL